VEKSNIVFNRLPAEELNCVSIHYFGDEEGVVEANEDVFRCD
jgi:hypothetical protein